MTGFKNRLSQNVEAVVDTGDRLVTTEIDHDNIHLGKNFRSWVNAGSIAAAGVFNVLIKTGAKEVHWRQSNPKPTADKLRLQFFEDTTVSANGTALTLKNCNRQSAVTPQVTLFHTPTITADGTQIAETYLPGSTGTGGVRNGSELGQQAEWVLKSNAIYLIRYTNESSGASIININFDWYEI